jgi:hypothetical protein
MSRLSGFVTSRREWDVSTPSRVEDLTRERAGTRRMLMRRQKPPGTNGYVPTTAVPIRGACPSVRAGTGHG